MCPHIHLFLYSFVYLYVSIYTQSTTLYILSHLYLKFDMSCPIFYLFYHICLLDLTWIFFLKVEIVYMLIKIMVSPEGILVYLYLLKIFNKQNHALFFGFFLALIIKLDPCEGMKGPPCPIDCSRFLYCHRKALTLNCLRDTDLGMPFLYICM